MVLQTISTESSLVPPVAAPSALDVRVTGGVVRGIREGAVLDWRGIPYAAPPVGDRRFRALFDQIDSPFACTTTALGGREPFSRAGERMRRHWLHFACTGIVESS